jgi:hypothetical protein
VSPYHALQSSREIFVSKKSIFENGAKNMTPEVFQRITPKHHRWHHVICCNVSLFSLSFSLSLDVILSRSLFDEMKKSKAQWVLSFFFEEDFFISWKNSIVVPRFIKEFSIIQRSFQSACSRSDRQ